MANPWIKRLVSLTFVGATIAGFAYALREKPIPVDIGEIDRGPIEVVIAEEGYTRIREIYKVYAPVSGRIDRVPLLVGDRVTQDSTVIAEIHPVQPPFQDLRTRRDLEASLRTAEAGVALAEAEVRRKRSDYSLAATELYRTERLFERNIVSQAALDKAHAEFASQKAGLLQAIAGLKMKRSERDGAQARLTEPSEGDNPHSGECCITVAAPHGGVVLSVPSKSERVVSQGTLLAEIGDPNDLEIIVDLLSSDAVRVQTGDVARIIGWGGKDPLEARVRRIDPVGFTKTSALGIEEQRVNVVLDLSSSPEKYSRLDHGFRVYVEVIVSQNEDSVRVPLSALFRDDNAWSVFRIEHGLAQMVHVTLGERNTRHALVLDSLDVGDLVILHPSDKVESELAVEDRSGNYTETIAAPPSIWKGIETYIRDLLAMRQT